MGCNVKNFLLPIVLMSVVMFGCAATQPNDGSSETIAKVDEPGGKANDFNPYLRKKLPNTRQLSADGAKMLGALGGKMQTIEGEAKHRKNWREEIYPVVFGDRAAPHEILAVLDFSSPKSEQDWKAVVAASKSLQPKQCKIVVFGRSSENYGTDLMGMAIWLAHERPGQAMNWLTYALSRWNAVKAAQKSSGKVKKFTNEYDATATAQDYPIHYGYLTKIQPPIPAKQELSVARYCYDAGNINMYQATQVCQYYGVSKLPAIIVDGKVLSKVTADSILAAVR